MIDSLTAQPAKYGIQVASDEKADVISWSNWHSPKDWFLYIVLALWLSGWLSIGLVVTVMAWRGDSLFVGLVVGSVVGGGVLLALTVYLRLVGKESISIADDEIELRFWGILRSSIKRFSRAQIRALSLEWHDEDWAQTLNLWCKDVPWYSKRRLLAYTLSNKAKAEVYQTLINCFQRRGWAIEFSADKRSSSLLEEKNRPQAKFSSSEIS